MKGDRNGKNIVMHSRGRTSKRHIDMAFVHSWSTSIGYMMNIKLNGEICCEQWTFHLHRIFLWSILINFNWLQCNTLPVLCERRKREHLWNRWNGAHIFVVNSPADIDMCAQLFIIAEFTEMRSKRITGKCEYGECVGRRSKRIRYLFLLHIVFFWISYFNWYRYPFHPRQIM